MKKEEIFIKIVNNSGKFVDVMPKEFSLFSTYHMDEPLWVCDPDGAVHRIYSINTYHASASLDNLRESVEIITASYFQSFKTEAAIREIIIGGDLDKVTYSEIGDILKEKHLLEAYFKLKQIELQES